MKKNELKSTIPQKQKTSLAGEYLNTIIERDVLLVILIMIGGLINKRGPLRGFPLPWLFPHGMHVRPEYLITDLLIVLAMVIAAEILTAVIKAATEPTAFRKHREVISVPKEIKEIQEIKQIKESAERVLNNTSVGRINDVKRRHLQKSGTSDQAFSFKILFIIIFATLAIIIASFSIISVTDHRDIVIDNDDDMSFYSDPEIFSEQKEEVISMLSEGGTDSLNAIGDGDAEALLEIAEWESIDQIEEATRDLDTVDSNAFIRYYVTCGETDYVLAIKLTGEDIENDSSSAVVTGIAACPYKIWDDYYASTDELSWEDLVKSIEDNKVVVGDDSYHDSSILVW